MKFRTLATKAGLTVVCAQMALADQVNESFDDRAPGPIPPTDIAQRNLFPEDPGDITADQVNLLSYVANGTINGTTAVSLDTARARQLFTGVYVGANEAGESTGGISGDVMVFRLDLQFRVLAEALQAVDLGNGSINEGANREFFTFLLSPSADPFAGGALSVRLVRRTSSAFGLRFDGAPIGGFGFAGFAANSAAGFPQNIDDDTVTFTEEELTSDVLTLEYIIDNRSPDSHSATVTLFNGNAPLITETRTPVLPTDDDGNFLPLFPRFGVPFVGTNELTLKEIASVDQLQVDNLFACALNEATDEDQDGLNQVEEFLAGTSDSNTDSDGDFFSDAAEVAAGSDPAAALSNPAIDQSIIFDLSSAPDGAVNALPDVNAQSAWVVNNGAAEIASPGFFSRFFSEAEIPIEEGRTLVALMDLEFIGPADLSLRNHGLISVGVTTGDNLGTAANEGGVSLEAFTTDGSAGGIRLGAIQGSDTDGESPRSGLVAAGDAIDVVGIYESAGYSEEPGVTPRSSGSSDQFRIAAVITALPLDDEGFAPFRIDQYLIDIDGQIVNRLERTLEVDRDSIADAERVRLFGQVLQPAVAEGDEPIVAGLRVNRAAALLIDSELTLDADTDQDSITDIAEIVLGTNFNNVDTDGDGLDDLEDPNPTVANIIVSDRITIRNVQIADEGLRIYFTCDADTAYRLAQSDDLVSGFAPVDPAVTVVTDETGQAVLVAPLASPLSERDFFRVEEVGDE